MACLVKRTSIHSKSIRDGIALSFFFARTGTVCQGRDYVAPRGGQCPYAPLIVAVRGLSFKAYGRFPSAYHSLSVVPAQRALCRSATARFADAPYNRTDKIPVAQTTPLRSVVFQARCVLLRSCLSLHSRKRLLVPTLDLSLRTRTSFGNLVTNPISTDVLRAVL